MRLKNVPHSSKNWRESVRWDFVPLVYIKNFNAKIHLDISFIWTNKKVIQDTT